MKVQELISELERKLNSLDEELHHELRKRGFDPEQLQTTALTGDLARMQVEREALNDRLMELRNNFQDGKLCMSETDRIADQFHRAFDGGAWHGPGVLELISDVSAADAAARPIPNAHSIWELVLHITAWKRVCKRRLEGEPAQLSDEENFPRVTDVSDSAWDKTKKELIDTHRQLLESLRKVDESRLDQPIVASTSVNYSTTYVTLHGGVQHDLYHAGQIAILKKALERTQES